jgi:hypothetical protein
MASASMHGRSRDKTASRSMFAHAETLTSSLTIGDEHTVIGFPDLPAFPGILDRNF